MEVVEIEHIFAPPAARPSNIIAIIFSAAVLVVFFIFLLKLSGLKLNSALYGKISQSATFLFFANVFAILAVLLWFWVCGNIIQAIQALLPLCLLFIFTAKTFFKAHSVAKED